MKIQEIEGGRLPQKLKKQTGSAKTESNFQEVMNRVVDNGTRGEAAASTGSLELPPDMVRPVQSAQNITHVGNIHTVGENALREVESALEMAGHYADKLADPAVKTEALRPLVSHLEERLQGLNHLVREAPLDGGLKEIISDLNINLVTEIAKFRRGDYS